MEIPIGTRKPKTADPLASVLAHPKGQPWRSLFTSLSEIDFPTKDALIQAEDDWALQFKPKGFITPSSTVLPPPEHDISDY